MKLTYTKVEFMHGQCSEPECPVCKNSTYEEMEIWLKNRLTITQSGLPRSPWWVALESNGDCYRKLRGNLKKKGFYDKNPDTH